MESGGSQGSGLCEASRQYISLTIVSLFGGKVVLVDKLVGRLAEVEIKFRTCYYSSNVRKSSLIFSAYFFQDGNGLGLIVS